MPNLFIIAGPNGAGKTSLSNQLISNFEQNVNVFDGDSFNSSIVNDEFCKAKMIALQAHQSFAYETTFCQEIIDGVNLAEHIAKVFKNAGYYIYFFLSA